MSTVSIPDNIHFYKKNELNTLPITITGGLSSTTFNLDRSKGVGKSEVATSLLGLPRAEGRMVLYEDTPQYGFDRNRWEARVSVGNQSDSTFYDPGYGGWGFATKRRLTNRKIDVGAARGISSLNNSSIPTLNVDVAWDPNALDPYCKTRGIQSVVYNLTAEHFGPIVYQDAENTSITLEGFPGDFQLGPIFFPPCVVPAYIQVPQTEGLYFCSLKSKETYRYEPGRVIGFTFGIATSVRQVSGVVWDPARYSHKREVKKATWGCKNNTDSYLFALDGSDGFKVIRKSIYKENNIILDRSQFIDPLDGTGPSKAKIDFEKVTMFSIEFSWYGAIGATFYVYLPYDSNKTKWIKIAELPSSNTYTMPALSDPYMYQYFELTIPHRCGKAHFLRKHGTSVYIDGSVNREDKKVFAKSGSVTTPLKKTANLTTNTRNLVSFEIPEKIGASSVSQYNKNKFFPLDISAYFTKDVLLTVAVSRKPTGTDVERADGASRFYSYPSKVFGLAKNAEELYFDSTGAYSPMFGTSLLRQGTKQNFNPQMFDTVLPLATNIHYGDETVYVTVPPETNVDKVIEDLINTHPLLYDDSLKNRYHQSGYLSVFRDVWASIPGLVGFNTIQGLEMLPRVKTVTKTGERSLALTLENYVPINTDGAYLTAFGVEALNPALVTSLGNMPFNYGPNYYGSSVMSGRLFGMFKYVTTNKTLEPNSPVYKASECQLLLKKSFYNNTSYNILGVPFDTGKIFFQRPEAAYSVGLIPEDHVEFLKSNNFFKNKTYPLNTPIERDSNNVEAYLKNHSVVYNTHEYNFYETDTNPGNSSIYKEQEPYQNLGWGGWYTNTKYWYRKSIWGHVDTYYSIKNGSIPGRNKLLPSYDSFPQPGYSFPPGAPTNSVLAGDELNLGYEVNSFECLINLTPENYFRETGEGINKDMFFWTTFNDIFYRNKDGVYTNSYSFWAMLLNNAGNASDFAKFYINDIEHLVRLSHRVTPGNVPGFSEPSEPYYTVDGTRLQVSVRADKLGIDYKNVSVKFKVRTVSPIFGKQNKSYSAFGEDTTNFNTNIIPNDKSLYFWFTLHCDLSGAPTGVIGTPGFYQIYNQNRSGNLTPNWRRLKIENDTRTALNNKLTIVKYDCRDKDGAQITSINSSYVNDITTFSLPSKPNDTFKFTDEISLSGTSYSNETFAQKGLKSQVNLNNNSTANELTTINKTTYYVPANKKTFINLKPFYNVAKTQILPMQGSSIQAFPTFFTITAKSVTDNNPADGILTINYEEAI